MFEFKREKYGTVSQVDKGKGMDLLRNINIFFLWLDSTLSCCN